MYGHRIEFEFSSDQTIEQIVDEIELNNDFINYCGAAWAGNDEEYKCIRSANGEWLTDKLETVEEFFKDLEKCIRFERITEKCK